MTFGGMSRDITAWTGIAERVVWTRMVLPPRVEKVGTPRLQPIARTVHNGLQLGRCHLSKSKRDPQVLERERGHLAA
jgi:hypothetical protein